MCEELGNRNRRRESFVEEALVGTYLAGVSVRKVEDMIEALWGSRVSPNARNFWILPMCSSLEHFNFQFI